MRRIFESCLSQADDGEMVLSLVSGLPGAEPACEQGALPHHPGSKGGQAAEPADQADLYQQPARAPERKPVACSLPAAIDAGSGVGCRSDLASANLGTAPGPDSSQHDPLGRSLGGGRKPKSDSQLTAGRHPASARGIGQPSSWQRLCWSPGKATGTESFATAERAW